MGVSQERKQAVVEAVLDTYLSYLGFLAIKEFLYGYERLETRDRQIEYALDDLRDMHYLITREELEASLPLLRTIYGLLSLSGVTP